MSSAGAVIAATVRPQVGRHQLGDGDAGGGRVRDADPGERSFDVRRRRDHRGERHTTLAHELVGGERGIHRPDLLALGLRAIGGGRGVHESGQERHPVHRDDAADELGRRGGDPEGQEAAEAVPDEDRPVESVGLDVADDLVPHARQEGGADRRGPAETGERQHVQRVAILVALDRRVPDLSRGQ